MSRRLAAHQRMFLRSRGAPSAPRGSHVDLAQPAPFKACVWFWPMQILWRAWRAKRATRSYTSASECNPEAAANQPRTRVALGSRAVSLCDVPFVCAVRRARASRAMPVLRGAFTCVARRACASRVVPVPASVPASVPVSVPVSVPASAPVSAPVFAPVSVPVSVPVPVPVPVPAPVRARCCRGETTEACLQPRITPAPLPSKPFQRRFFRNSFYHFLSPF